MVFNLKKNAQKAKNSVLPQATGLQDNAKKYNLSLQDEKFIPNFNTFLEEDRRPLEGKVQTHEAMLDDIRKKANTPEKITEGSLDDADSPLYPHRQFKDGEDSYHVTPINATSAVFDKKYRDAFSKANKDPDTAFWDKYVGAQLDDKMTKVPNNVPLEGSQLPSNPGRFESVNNLPTDSSAIVNRDNFSSRIDVKPMHGFIKGEKGLKMAMSSLKDADGLLFGIYLKAAKEKRSISEDEQKLICGINKDKKNLLVSLAQMLPPNTPGFHNPVDPLNPEDSHNQADPLNPEGPQDLPAPSMLPNTEDSLHPEREVDFLDGSPDVTNDPRLWATQSGFDPNMTDMGDEQDLPPITEHNTGSNNVPGLNDVNINNSEPDMPFDINNQNKKPGFPPEPHNEPENPF